MVQFMKVNGITGRHLEMVNFNILMEMSMKDSGQTIKLMDMDFTRM